MVSSLAITLQLIIGPWTIASREVVKANLQASSKYILSELTYNLSVLRDALQPQYDSAVSDVLEMIEQEKRERLFINGI